MTDRIFKFEIPAELVADRQMTRERWYAISRYLRCAASLVHKVIDHDKLRKHFTDLAFYGQARVDLRDLLKI